MKKKTIPKKSRPSRSKKFTTVKSRHLDDSYTDPDVVLSFTMFEILTRYLEKESGNIDWAATPEHAKAMHTLNHLAFWFNKIYVPYKLDKKDYFPIVDGPEELLLERVNEDGKKHYILNREGYDDFWENISFRGDMDDNMQYRLIKNMKILCDLSPYLWS